ncbi:MAG: hypothetical protein JSS99_03985 [Actinobacteria bacterium]|nr:hypothetical protein [Actinomycetota bacterium]
MDVFRDFSGRHVQPIVRFAFPANLAQLRGEIVRAEAEGLAVHAVGAALAFSAPAYCAGVVVDLRGIAGFPQAIQRAIGRADRGRSVLLAVHAGIRIHELDRVLEQRPPGRHPLAWLAPGRRLALPTHGGASLQTLAGAVSTGTHGGDAARPPIGDCVHAAIVVGSGGDVSVVQRANAPVLDFPALERTLLAEAGRGVAVVDVAADDALDAAVVALGRVGVVYAYVVEVADETGTLVFEHRTKRRWSDVRDELDLATPVARAVADDGFLQYVINPVRDDGDRTCYETRHLQAPDTSIGHAGALFGIRPVASADVVAERGRMPLPPEFGRAFCVDHITPELAAVRDVLRVVAVRVALELPPFGAIVAGALLDAAASIDRIGPEHRVGDVLADLVNLATSVPCIDLNALITNAVLDGAQSDTRSAPPGVRRPPWLVHGTRAQIADVFGEALDGCYGGDSVELLFDAAPGAGLPAKVDGVLEIFDALRAEGRPIGGYLSLRFLARTRSLLGMAAWSSTCAIEIAMLRGLEGNGEALDRLQRHAARNDGRVHWGEENDLSAAEVSLAYGERLARWRTVLHALEGDSQTFSTPFTRAHGLELPHPERWAAWGDAGIVAGSPPGVVSAAGGRPLQAFVVDADGRVRTSLRAATAVSSAWHDAGLAPVDPRATPVPTRGHSGRVELFVRGDDRLKHSWEQERPGGPFAAWDTKGAPLVGSAPRISCEPAVAAHADGRLEALARAGDQPARLLHTWARWVDGPWSELAPLGSAPIAVAPSVCLRRHATGGARGDQLVAVAKLDDGTVVWTAQTGPGGDSGWTPPAPLQPPGGAPLAAANRPLAVEALGTNPRLRVLAVDARGHAYEALDDDRSFAIGWGPWQPLPPLPGGARLDPTSALVAVHAVHAVALVLLGTCVDRTVTAIELGPAGWGRWTGLGGEVDGQIAAGVLEDGRVELLANAPSGRLMARRQPW